MTTIAPLPIEADRQAAHAWHHALLSASREFVAQDCPSDAEGVAALLDDESYPQMERGGHIGWMMRHGWQGSAEVEALAVAWESAYAWYKRNHADFLAANPREALREAIGELSRLVLHARWSDNTPYAVWQVAILGQPPAVFSGLLAKANGQWLNGNPDAPESRELVSEVRRLHQETGGWWWNPDVDADDTFLPTAQWEHVYARTLHDPDRGCAVVSMRADGSRKVYRGREGVGQWLDDNPAISEALGGCRKP